jgi:ankyrin repeat protein
MTLKTLYFVLSLGLMAQNSYSMVNDIWNAATKGDLSSVQMLVESGTDINVRNHENATALHLVTSCGHTELAKWLVDNGAYSDAQNKNGLTALHLAAQNGSTDMVELLVKNGADIDSQDCCRMTPLYYAACAGHIGVVECLVGNGANINVQACLYGDTNNVVMALNTTNNNDIRRILKYYSELEKEAQDNPTLETLTKIIQYGDYTALVCLVLCRRIILTQDIYFLAQEYSRKKVGRILKAYLCI